MCPSDPSIVYAGGGAVVYRSEDAGLTWKQVAGQGGDGWGPPGVLAGTPIDMQCDPRDPNRIFSNNYLGGNFLSTDGGKTWVNASDGYTGAQIMSLPGNMAQVLGFIGFTVGIFAKQRDAVSSGTSRGSNRIAHQGSLSFDFARQDKLIAVPQQPGGEKPVQAPQP